MTPHGTVSRYRHNGCRCEACTRANRLLSYRVRDNLQRRPRSEVPHGTRGGYVNWGCRCPGCSAANSAFCKAYYLKRRAAS